MAMAMAKRRDAMSEDEDKLHGNGRAEIVEQSDDPISAAAPLLEQIAARAKLGRSVADGHDGLYDGVQDLIGDLRRMIVRVETGAGPRWRPAVHFVDEIVRHADEHWVPLRLGDKEIEVVRPGGTVLLVGATGRGKTSLVGCLLVDHALHRGPSIAMSLELPGDELVARSIGARLGAGWRDVLRARDGEGRPLSRAQMIGAVPERLVVVDRRGRLADLDRAICDLQDAHPEEPIMVGVDYVQIAALDLAESEREHAMRMSVGRVMRRLDELARSRRVVIIALSQGSRLSSRALSTGERVGADTIDAGAESADLERWATLTVAIGKIGDIDETGTSPAELSVGKGRMGGGDRVIPARYCGRSGLWKIVGHALSGDDVRSKRRSDHAARRQSEVERAILESASSFERPVTREELGLSAGTRPQIWRAAIRTLLKRGDLVEVNSHRSRSRAYLIWTAKKARAAGLPIIDQEDST